MLATTGKSFPTALSKHLPRVETRLFACPQTFWTVDFHCEMDVCTTKETFWNWKELLDMFKHGDLAACVGQDNATYASIS